MPKNALFNTLVVSGDMSASLSGSIVDVRYLDTMAVQANASFNSTAPQGNVVISGSNDHEQYFGDVVRAGTFVQLDTIPYASVGGSFIKALGPTAISYLKIEYVSTFNNVVNVTCTGNAAGVLNNKYFFINNSPTSGGGSVSYYVWYNSDDTGIDPMVPGRTGIEVDVQAGDADVDVAQNTNDAINLIAASHLSAVNTGPAVAITMVNAGGGSGVDFNTGFTISLASTDGALSVYLSAKSL